MTQLLETTYSSDIHVDTDKKVICGVRVCGKVSKNGRTYSDNAMKQLAGFYEGIEVNIDHPSRENPTAERSIADGFGVLENVKLGKDGVYADLHYLESHPQAAVILERTERFPNNFGLSHNAEGQLEKRGDDWVVESVDRVHSVDLVGKPATNKGLFESQEEETMKTTLRELIEKATPSHAKAIVEMLHGDEGLGADVGASLEMAAEDEANPAEAVATALAKEAEKIFLDPKVSPKDTGKQIAELAKVVEDVKAKVAPGAVEEEPVEENTDHEDENKPFPESIVAENLLLRAGREATPEQIVAVAAVPAASRKALVESWPAKDSGEVARAPRPGSSKPLTESVDADFDRDPEKFAASLR